MRRPASPDPGELRHELALQEPLAEPDGLGGFAVTWTTTSTVFARIEPLRVTQVFVGAQETEQASHVITIRQRAGVKSGMRFLKAGRAFRIITVNDPDETGRFLVCATEELP